MDLENRTDVSAGMLRTTLGERRILAAVVVRSTYRIEGESLAPTLEEPLAVDGAPRQTPVGKLPGDQPFLSGGVDVMVVGKVTTSPDEPRERVDLAVRVGESLEQNITVFGDRVWERRDGVLVPSAPEPFTEMPLAYERSFGGEATTEDGPFSWPANPDGRGFYLDEESAEGGPLPNLEDSGALVRTWEDRPRVVGTAPYPSGWELALLNAVDVVIDEEQPERSHLRAIEPTYFNVAHPDLIIPAAKSPVAGDLVEIRNARAGETVRFALPEAAYHLHVQLEKRSHLFPLHLDQIGVLLDEGRVFLSHRVVFRYSLVRFERRRATLYPGAIPESLPEEYPVDWTREEPVFP